MSENTFTPAKLSTPTRLYHPTTENAAYGTFGEYSMQAVRNCAKRAGS